jgi:hypothetical protein
MAGPGGDAELLGGADVDACRVADGVVGCDRTGERSVEQAASAIGTTNPKRHNPGRIG